MRRVRHLEARVRRSLFTPGALLLVAAVVLALAPPPAAGAVCSDGILDASEECDPNCGTPGSPASCPLYLNGDPTLATCTTGTTCFYRFTCCKFNCQFVGTAVPCADGNDCTTNDVCNMTGQCLAGSFTGAGTSCGDPTATQCNLADTCNGAGTCLQNLVAAGTTADVQCADGSDCTLNQCNGMGGCQNPFSASGASCGDATVNECTAPDTCNGSGTCNANHAAAGTPAPALCTDPSTCTFDECNGMGGCQNPSKPDGSECRPTGGPCDQAEQCAAGVCPGDGKVTPGTECRATTDVCDPAEACDGIANACPGDLKLPDGTACRTAAGSCDVLEECAAGVCPPDAKSTAVCNPSVGVCDPAESCDGVGDDCPADVGLEDGAACDDGNECTIAGACLGQVCVPTGPAFVVTGRSLVCRDSAVNMSVLLDNELGVLGFLRNVMMADDTTLAAHRVRLYSGSSAFDVVANYVDGPGDIRGTFTPAFTPSGAGALCVATPVLCGGPDVTVGTSGPLAPGTYGNVVIAEGVTATLSAGTYEMCSLRILPQGSLLVAAGEAGPTVRIAGLLRGSRFVTVGPGVGAGRPRFEVGRKVSFAADSTITAHLAIPNGKLALGRRLVFDGTACTRKVLTLKETSLSCNP